MAVQQNDFRHLFTGNLPFAAQTEHMFGVFPLVGVTHTGLAGKERLKTFALQVIQQDDGRDAGIALAARFVLFLTEHAGNIVSQFITG